MRICLAVLVALLACPSVAAAYIGPGAGFAFLSSFFLVITTLVVAIVALVRWPFRLAWRLLRGGGGRRRAHAPRARRLIVLGFDGQEPTLTDRYLAAGQLPHFAALAARGGYYRLRTTLPPLSPVAWSCFATGANPGKTNIFDFLDRDRRSYLPRLSSARVGRIDRALTIGRFRLPLRRPELRLLRRSRPFWAILGEARIWSTILRVPITFPPERFHGAQLSAMAAPDLLGTQGTFLLYTTRPARDSEAFKEGGVRISLTFGRHDGGNGGNSSANNSRGSHDQGRRAGEWADTRITGPENPFAADGAPLVLPMRIHRDRSAGSATATIDVSGQRVTLAVGVLSEWMPLAFRAAPFITIRGLCRMQVRENDAEQFSLYVTPISLDPEHPAMPISHPPYYAPYLAKAIGPYSTLGLAEDTWALNEGVTDEETFLRQAWDIDEERRRMCLVALDRLREGTLVCVFDATDRVQHMGWRHLGSSNDAIAEQYRRNDAFLGQVLARVTDDDVVMVLSDHGFNAFRRGVNVNRWLLDHGYLALKAGTDGSGAWLRDVDWSRTRAYALGLTGIYLNLAGREGQGLVQPGVEAARVKAEILAGLGGLRDQATIAVRELFDTAAAYDGPYVGNAPDLIVGYEAGYRVSWNCASGMVSGPLFEDNEKAWSGDHCVHPDIVPGVLFCSRPIARADPALIDIAPTALWLFGLDVPRHMDGRSLFEAAPATSDGPAKRRLALLVLCAAVVLAGVVSAAGCGRRASAPGVATAGKARVIVLGFDGLDYELTRTLMAAGRLPHLSRLARMGGFAPLATTMPPQSPVAWSTFATGLDPHDHGIYDFVHRDPATRAPYLSTTRTEPPRWRLPLGPWQIPLRAGRVIPLRDGQPFWAALERRGVPTTLIRMPANYPPSGLATRELSGMGTPDLLGTYGTFSFYTSAPSAPGGAPSAAGGDREPVAGGVIHRVRVVHDVLRATLEGPANPLRRDAAMLTVPFTLYRDPGQEVAAARLIVGDEQRVLKVGEWSDWVPIAFTLAPWQSLRGMCRVYLKQLRPDVELYVSPINLDPLAPAQPISTPSGYAADLATATGRFYTQGMPEDTKSLSSGVFDRDEFLRQARDTAGENVRQYDVVLDQFREGLLFYYFGHVDQVSHMVWRSMDTAHPAYDAARDAPYAHVIEDLYIGLDAIVGRTLDRMPAETLLVVMSDHGFASWRRAFHLNAWLEQHGYLTVRDAARRGMPMFESVDWSRTRAYGLGLNGLYLNVRGRESSGIVDPAQRATLAVEIATALRETRDPETGQPAIAAVYQPSSPRHPERAPDLVIGYAKGTRCSNESALGQVPSVIMTDNTEAWSGDHCMDPAAVPGVLFTSRPLRVRAASLHDLSGALAAEFQ